MERYALIEQCTFMRHMPVWSQKPQFRKYQITSIIIFLFKHNLQCLECHPSEFSPLM